MAEKNRPAARVYVQQTFVTGGEERSKLLEIAPAWRKDGSSSTVFSVPDSLSIAPGATVVLTDINWDKEVSRGPDA